VSFAVLDSGVAEGAVARAPFTVRVCDHTTRELVYQCTADASATVIDLKFYMFAEHEDGAEAEQQLVSRPSMCTLWRAAGGEMSMEERVDEVDALGDKLSSLLPSRRAFHDGLNDDDDDDDDDDIEVIDGGRIVDGTLELLIKRGRLPPAGKAEPSPAMSRFDTMKQLFHSFSDRQGAFGFAINVGLMTFNRKHELTCPISGFYERFKKRLDTVAPKGGTRLYDALAAGAAAVRKWMATHPGATGRLLCISDGKDAGSVLRPPAVRALLADGRLTLDVIAIGEERDRDVDLKTLAKSTNGYYFAPASLRDALKLCEFDPMLCLSERPAERDVDAAFARTFQLFEDAAPDRCDVLPACRQRPELDAAPTTLARAIAAAEAAAAAPPAKRAKVAVPAAAAANASANGAAASASSIAVAVAASPPRAAAAANALAGRQRRVLRELRALYADPHLSIDVYPNESDIYFWCVVIAGPEGSLFEGGTFLLYLSFPDDYPCTAPTLHFITSVIHCNVNAAGRVCHFIFDRAWTVDTTVRDLLNTVFGLLMVMDPHDPVDALKTIDFYADRAAYELRVRTHVREHAMGMTRDSYRGQIEESGEAAVVPAPASGGAGGGSKKRKERRA
jgi:ubiquitin-protein ligase